MQLGRIVAATLALTLSACADGGGPGSNRTRIFLTDSPFPYDLVARVDVHIVRVDAAASLDTMNGSVDWVNVVTPNRTVNLLDLQAGTTTLLGEADLPAGRYEAIRMIINTTLSAVTLRTGALADVQWPLQGELALHTIVDDPLEVSPQGARIVLDFDVGRSFLIHPEIPDSLSGGTSQPRFVFIPWIRAVNDAATGTLTGLVTGVTPGGIGPLADIAVTVLTGTPTLPANHFYPVATSRTDAQGRYRIAFLREHLYYAVRFEGGTCFEASGVSIAAGRTTTLNAAMPFDPMDCWWWNNPDTTGGGGGDTTLTNPGGPVASVTVAPAAQAASIGDSIGVYAVLANANGLTLVGRPVTFTSSDPSVVAVTAVFGQSALLRATGSGSATITATSEAISGTGSVTVR
jgi:hypothetical protein